MEKPHYSTLLLMISIIGCSSHSTDQQANVDANRDLVKAYHQVWSNGRINDLDTLLASDYIGHFVGGTELKGIDGAKTGITKLRQSFPDWKEDIVDMVAEGDKVVTRYTSTGTHKGSYKGIDATARKVTIDEVSIYRIANGKIAEDWSYNDPLSLTN